MANFKVGDVVNLKSEPAKRMTIESISADGKKATCVWIDKLKKGSGEFVLETLKLYVSNAGRITLR